MWPDAPPSTAGYHPRVIELHLFVPGADGSHTSLLQEDDGLTFDSRQGAHHRTTLEVTRAGDRLTLQGDVSGRGYPGFRREELHLVIHGATPDSAEVDGARVPVVDGRVTLPNQGTSFSLTLTL